MSKVLRSKFRSEENIYFDSRETVVSVTDRIELTHNPNNEETFLRKMYLRLGFRNTKLSSCGVARHQQTSPNTNQNGLKREIVRLFVRLSPDTYERRL